MKRGILVYDQQEQEWRVWIVQQRYWIQQGYSFELRIQHRYYHAYLEKDLDWFVTLNGNLKLILHTQEIYKVRIHITDYMLVDAPF